jgi:hypothetical protein
LGDRKIYRSTEDLSPGTAEKAPKASTEKPSGKSGIKGIWLLATVGTQSISLLGVEPLVSGSHS